MENLRLQHNLNENDIFFCIGGYTGEISDKIIAGHNPYVYIFEPSKKWFEYLKNKYINNKKVNILNFGVHNEPGELKLYGDGAVANLFGLDQVNTETSLKIDNYEICEIRKLSDYIKDFNEIKFVEINCEGAEYGIIEDLFVNNTLDKFEDIQIQFHRIAGYKELVDKTRKMLSTTHDLIWCFDMIWECWRRKK